MSEPHAEPPAADVRSFLPRPGEPVEDYAARLRALHHDLSLVLDAVERGLAAAERRPAPAEGEPPAEPYALAQPVAAAGPRRSPPARPSRPARGRARVEVVATPHEDEEGEREWIEPPEPEGAAPGGGRRAPMGEGAPAGGEPAAPSPARWPYPEPWVERGERPPRAEPWQEVPPPPEPAAAWPPPGRPAPPPPPRRRERPMPWEPPAPWTEGRGPSWPEPPRPPAEMSFEPAPHAPFAQPPRRRVTSVSPTVLAALILGWLTAVALGLALALGL